MDPIDIPSELLAATSIAWRMDANHGRAESVFSGIGQMQRGQIERWAFVMAIRRLSRVESQVAQGFFLRLEGPLGTFRMHDPAAPRPLGIATGSPVLAAEADAGDRTLATAGWTPNVPRILRAGDWLQVGDQLAKLRADADSAADGTATLDIWPKVMVAVPSTTAIVVRPARGIFRFLTQPPEWEADSSERGRPYTFQLSGVQEVLTD